MTRRLEDRRPRLALVSTLTLVWAGKASKTAYLQSYGGTIQALLRQLGVADKFHADTGYKVMLVPKVTGDEIIGTAIVQADGPHIDLVFVDEAIWMRGLQRDIFAPLDPKDFPNFSDLPVAFVKKAGQIYGVAPYADIVGILYQPEIFKSKVGRLNAWKDLFRPEFRAISGYRPSGTMAISCGAAGEDEWRQRGKHHAGL